MVETQLVFAYCMFIAGLSMYIFSIINGAESFMAYSNTLSWITGWIGYLIMDSSIIYASLYHSSRQLVIQPLYERKTITNSDHND